LPNPPSRLCLCGARRPSQNIAPFSNMGLRGPSSGTVPDAGGRNRGGATDLPGQVEHIIAYAGSTAIAMAGYGLNRGPVRVIGWFWLYAGVLEYLQNFSPGRNPAVVDFAASTFGAVCGGVAVLLLWRWRSAPLGPRDGA